MIKSILNFEKYLLGQWRGPHYTDIKIRSVASGSIRAGTKENDLSSLQLLLEFRETRAEHLLDLIFTSHWYHLFLSRWRKLVNRSISEGQFTLNRANFFLR